MNYSETYKKSQTRPVPGGFTTSICCKYVTNVTNEYNEKLKFTYDAKNETLTILSNDFNLLTVEYGS